MKKRILSAFTAALLLLSTLPALAAEGTAAVRVLGTNGTVTAGVRTVPGGGRTVTYPNSTPWNEDLVEMVYTTDGVTWKTGTQDWADSYGPVRGFYNGTEFLAYQSGGFSGGPPDARSEDGIHWTTIPAEDQTDYRTCPPGYAEAAGYRFELRDGELYLVDGEKAALLPALGEAARKEKAEFYDVQAYSVPNGIRVEAYPAYDFPTHRFVVDYPVSSLDWVRENQSTEYWSTEELGRWDNGGAAVIRKLAVGPGGERWEASTDGGGTFRPLPAVWDQTRDGAKLLPWNGKSFVLQDNRSLRLYASEDGVSWRPLQDTFLGVEREAGRAELRTSTSQHALTWTGTEYLACRRTAEIVYSVMMGGRWYSPYNTKVCFADGNFDLTGSYDFGRQVLAAGYYDGVYYVQVSDNTGVSEQEYDRNAGSAIYRSTDKVNWERTGLQQIISSIRTLE